MKKTVCCCLEPFQRCSSKWWRLSLLLFQGRIWCVWTSRDQTLEATLINRSFPLVHCMWTVAVSRHFLQALQRKWSCVHEAKADFSFHGTHQPCSPSHGKGAWDVRLQARCAGAPGSCGPTCAAWKPFSSSSTQWGIQHLSMTEVLNTCGLHVFISVWHLRGNRNCNLNPMNFCRDSCILLLRKSSVLYYLQ